MRIAARRRYRETVLGPAPPAPGPAAGPPHSVWAGTILDASPHLLVLHTGTTEVRLPMTPATTVWHGGRAGPDALRPGRAAIVRPGAGDLGAERVWVDIGRVVGTILSCDRGGVEVDMGPHRGRVHVVIPPHTHDQVRVRHPRLEPGYLFDVVCVGSPEGPRAVRPATSQPGHLPIDLAAPGPETPVADAVYGTATWFGGAARTVPVTAGPDSDPAVAARRRHDGIPGVAYPAVDPEGDAGGCTDIPEGCTALPYLSVGSQVRIVNECTDRAADLPVLECGCLAARFCDRCVECGTSPRGRLVELTPAAFVALGGDLEAGCFNAVLRHDAPRGSDRPW